MFAWIITVIIAIGSFLSSFLVAIVNNRHQRKMRMLELEHDISTKKLTIFYEDKKIAFSNFLLNAGKMCTDDALFETEQDFYAYSHQASLFASEENQKLISQFTSEIMCYVDDGIPPEKYEYFRSKLANISSSLNKELSDLLSEICDSKNRK